MIEILVPNFYDSTNNIFSKNIIKKIVICKNNIFTKINTSINENENIIYINKNKPWHTIILEIINEYFNNKRFKVKDIQNLIQNKKKYKIPDKGLHPYFTKLYNKNKLINKDKKKGYWYLKKKK